MFREMPSCLRPWTLVEMFGDHYRVVAAQNRVYLLKRHNGKLLVLATVFGDSADFERRHGSCAAWLRKVKRTKAKRMKKIAAQIQKLEEEAQTYHEVLGLEGGPDPAGEEIVRKIARFLAVEACAATPFPTLKDSAGEVEHTWADMLRKHLGYDKRVQSD